MKDLKGTKTESNLWEAFAGESKARNKYTYYASKAKKDGYEQIAALFEETAAQEKEHAKLCSNSFTVLVLPLRTSKTARWARTRSGQTCIHVWQKKLAKKASRRLLS